jgi:DNA-binding response OmpR family regulator
MAKILLVEDDQSLREIYSIRLTAEGYEIISAGDGEAALALAVREKPDLILSDVMMPKISGFDMLDILRQTAETKDIKVIMMTALSSEDQRERGNALGADRYLVKSQVGIEDVVNAVHEVLNDTGAAAPAPAEAPVNPVSTGTEGVEQPQMPDTAPVQPNPVQPEAQPVAQPETQPAPAPEAQPAPEAAPAPAPEQAPQAQPAAPQIDPSLFSFPGQN